MSNSFHRQILRELLTAIEDAADIPANNISTDVDRNTASESFWVNGTNLSRQLIDLARCVAYEGTQRVVAIAPIAHLAGTVQIAVGTEGRISRIYANGVNIVFDTYKVTVLLMPYELIKYIRCI